MINFFFPYNPPCLWRYCLSLPFFGQDIIVKYPLLMKQPLQHKFYCADLYFFLLLWGNNCMLPLELIYLQPASTAARCVRQPRCLWCQCWNPRDGWGWQYKNLDECVTAEKELFPTALRTGEVPATPEIEGQTFFPASSSLSSKKYFLSQLLSVVCNHCRRPSIPSRLW